MNMKKLLSYISIRRKKQFWLILFIMIFASITEVISLGSVIPFLSVLTSPIHIYQHPLIQPLIQLFSLDSSEQLLLPITVIFVIAALFSGLIRIILLYATTRYSFAVGADLSFDIYRKTLYQDYKNHLSRNSIEIMSGVSKTSVVVSNIILPILNIISSGIIIIAILVVLLTVNATIAIASFAGIGFLYWVLIRCTRQNLRENSQSIAYQSTQILKAIQEGLGGIRDVLLCSNQQFYSNLFRQADIPMRRARGSNVFISGSPRFAMEAIGMTLIAGIAYIISLREGGLFAVIPTLGALALGAQRLLPAMQQVFYAYSNIRGAQSSLNDVLTLLDQPLPSFDNQPLSPPIPFNKEFLLNNISFRYSDKTPWILNNINLRIRKGESIGFIGSSGAGKSTMLDIIMGLLHPDNGELVVDSLPLNRKNLRAWQAHIAHVPQNIYLYDSTISENIAFGVRKENINIGLVKKAATMAQIANTIENWPKEYHTLVGEQGIRLSGGQKQRIGIARALYRQADVLIFDEATSALDHRTEQSLMHVIDGLGEGITKFIVSHRITTLKCCDRIIDLSNNKTTIPSHT
jgi:ATP-binding cassette, subfamily B, bacterial PglK